MIRIFSILLPILFVGSSYAETASLHGQVFDESGAIVPGARVKVTPASGATQTAAASPDGSYTFANLPSGEVTVQASAPDLALREPIKLTVKAGSQVLDLKLHVLLTQQQVSVEDTAGTAVAVDPSSNATATVLRGADLEALADDPNDLAADLQALAGPAAGPNGGEIYIDGFSGGQIPSKESIREIRINQNPFSPEYDKLGFGRIEILTKPGTDKFRGTAFYNFADDFWNSRNPYADVKAPFLLREYGGSIGGPINRRSSFFVDLRRDATDNGSVINAVTVDPVTFEIAPFSDVFRVDQRALRASPRIDYQLSTNNTLTFRYAFSDMSIPGAGIGSFNLTSRGYDVDTDTHTVQLTETAVLSARVINEVRFQYFRAGIVDQVHTTGPALNVLGSFNGGGAPIGSARDRQNSYEFQDYVSLAMGAHTWRFGVRLRAQTDDTLSPQNFGGTFTFGGGTGPQLDAANRVILDANGQPEVVRVSSAEQYRRTLLFQSLGYTPAQIRSLGGGATQFTIVAGNASLSARQFDIGAFAGDDWRVRPNLTVSLGLRYETQTNIHDWRDVAPRIGIAWAPGRSNGKNARKTVIRGGFGIFYDRFALGNTLTVQRYNGLLQRQYVIANPDFFPAIPSLVSLPSRQITERVASDLRAPYIIQTALGVERQLPKNTTVAVTYANSRGVHMLRSRDVNAPVPGTNVYPLGTAGPVFLMESSGIYKQNQLIANVNSRLNSNVSLFGAYMLNHAMSDTDGVDTFPANPYNYAGEYGPAATDIRHRVSFGGSLNTKWNVRLSPFLVAESGPPFDITAGQDLYGTTLFNARPGIATDPNKPGVIATPYGLLDSNPTPGERFVPRNYGRGPGSILFNMRLAKTIGFGRPRGESAASGPARATAGPFGSGERPLAALFSATPTTRPYNVIISINVRNVLNHNNPGPIIGNITSPLFGRANQAAGSRDLGGGGFSEAANNRRLELQIRFTF